jgi:hypothetical protein
LPCRAWTVAPARHAGRPGVGSRTAWPCPGAAPPPGLAQVAGLPLRRPSRPEGVVGEGFERPERPARIVAAGSPRSGRSGALQLVRLPPARPGSPGASGARPRASVPACLVRFPGCRLVRTPSGRNRRQKPEVFGVRLAVGANFGQKRHWRSCARSPDRGSFRARLVAARPCELPLDPCIADTIGWRRAREGVPPSPAEVPGVYR